LAELPVPLRTQVGALKVPLPIALKVTLPVGVVGVPESMSLTVAVQAADCPGAITVGVQLTPVAVKRRAVAVAAVAATPEDPGLA